MSQKTHFCLYRPFLITNTPVKWINLDVLPMTGLCGSFPGWLLIVIKVFMGIFTFWGTKCPPKHISVRIYPSRWQIHPWNGSILMFFQWLDFVDHFPGDFWELLRFLWAFSLFGAQNVPQNTFLSVSTLPDDRFTREMDQSWCSSNDWTLWIISRVIFESY